mgnify:CR=1 FL=1
MLCVLRREMVVLLDQTANVLEFKIVNKQLLELLVLKEPMDHVYGLINIKMLMEPKELVSNTHHVRV